MGEIGRLLGGALGDMIEDKIRGDTSGKRKARRKRNETLIPWLPSDGPVRGPLPVPRLPVGAGPKNGRGFLDTVFGPSVKPKAGSVLCCRLAGVFDHTGVYVGRGRIIHRDGDGFLAIVTKRKFLERLGGLNPALYVYVACNEHGKPVGNDEIARRAREAMKNPEMKRGYNLLTKNCHQFTEYCVTGDVDNGPADFTFTNLEKVLEGQLGMDHWVKWE